MEKPSNLRAVTFDYIFDYIQAKGKEDKAWLKKLASKKIVKDKGERDISFIEIRNEFVKKYIPEIIPPPKEKPPTMRDKLALL